MSYGESNERRRSNLGFRTSMDLGMGVIYVAVGCIVIYMRALGAIEVYPAIPYILGAIMIIGGVARFYRGIKAAMGKK
jgi:hypothetical protein